MADVISQADALKAQARAVQAQVIVLEQLGQQVIADRMQVLVHQVASAAWELDQDWECLSGVFGVAVDEHRCCRCCGLRLED